MRNVVHSERGTAWNSVGRRLTRYDIAGKTGTAQVINMKQGETYRAELLKEWHRDHAWFMGFAPVENPGIAVAVLVENGGHGGSAAAPVVKAVMDAWFDSQSAVTTPTANGTGGSDTPAGMTTTPDANPTRSTTGVTP
jgi:penicillin-binding protein 2